MIEYHCECGKSYPDFGGVVFCTKNEHLASPFRRDGKDPDGWELPLHFPIIVTGTPKSGTHFAADLLRHYGFDVGHECLRKGGIVSCFYAIDNSNEFAEDPPLSQMEFDTRIRLVRDPKANILSLAGTISPRWWRWQTRYTGVIPSDPITIDQVAAFYVAWHAFVPDTYEVVRLEDIAHLLPPSGVSKNKTPRDWSEISPPALEAVEKTAGAFGYG